MSNLFTLDDIEFGDEELDTAWRQLRQAVETLSKWTITGAVEFEADAQTGFVLHVKNQRVSMSAVAASGGITAQAGTKFGKGNATLIFRNGEDQTSGPTIVVYSNMPIAIPAGTRLELEPDGEAYKLVTAHCVAT